MYTCVYSCMYIIHTHMHIDTHTHASTHSGYSAQRSTYRTGTGGDIKQRSTIIVIWSASLVLHIDLVSFCDIIIDVLYYMQEKPQCLN